MASWTPAPDNRSATIDLSTVFSGASSYGVASSDPSVATISLNGSIATATSVGDGVATLTLTGTNATGSTPDVVQCTVAAAANQAPTVSSPLADVSGTVGDAGVVTDLDTVFSDPDGDALTYSLDGSPASASLSGTRNKTLTVSRASEVDETVTVRATDPGSLDVTDSFAVDVNAAAANIDQVINASNPSPGSISGVSDPVIGQAPSLFCTHEMTVASAANLLYFARFVDANNWVREVPAAGGGVKVEQNVAGVVTTVIPTQTGVFGAGSVSLRFEEGATPSDPHDVTLLKNGAVIATGTTTMKTGLGWGFQGSAHPALTRIQIIAL